MIHFTCPSCSKAYKVRPELAGRQTRCRQCGQAMQVPMAPAGDESPPAPPPQPAANSSAYLSRKTCGSCGKPVHPLAHACPRCGSGAPLVGDYLESELPLIQQAQSRARQLNDQGGMLLQQKRYAQAIEAFEQAIQANPHNANAHGNIGSALCEQGRFADAVPWLEKALALDPKLDGVAAALEAARKRAAVKQIDKRVRRFVAVTLGIAAALILLSLGVALFNPPDRDATDMAAMAQKLRSSAEKSNSILAVDATCIFARELAYVRGDVPALSTASEGGGMRLFSHEEWQRQCAEHCLRADRWVPLDSGQYESTLRTALGEADLATLHDIRRRRGYWEKVRADYAADRRPGGPARPPRKTDIDLPEDDVPPGETAAAAQARVAEELRLLGALYLDFLIQTGSPPRNALDLAEHVPEPAPALKIALQKIHPNQEYVVRWRVDPNARRDLRQPREHVLAHERRALTQGGAVLLGDGSVVPMSAAELAAKLAALE